MDCSDVLDREDRNALVNGEVERAQVEKVQIEERQVPVLLVLVASVTVSLTAP